MKKLTCVRGGMEPFSIFPCNQGYSSFHFKKIAVDVSFVCF